MPNDVSGISCQDVEDVIMRSCDPDLFQISSKEKGLAEEHLKICEACRGFNRLVIEQRLKAALAQAHPEYFPDLDMTEEPRPPDP
jgi:predicted anti-sigma-YlaC factor YlaD